MAKNKLIPSWEPHGLAIQSCFNGNMDAQIGILMDDGETVFMPASIYFREKEEIPELEQIALNHCKGKTLDVGAGAGAHSLLLQENGIDVTALDIDPKGVEIMRSRGVKHTVCGDFLSYNPKENFDSLLFLMNGIGIAESLNGLKSFFNHAKEISNPNAQIILDSSDLRISNPDLDFKESYFGEVDYQLSFEGVVGEKYTWLYIDFDTLSDIADELAWKAELILENEDGSYLAKLSLI